MISKQPNINSSFGFTIIELLVVIVIIGILATISVISFNGIQQRAAGTVLISDLKNASAQLEITKYDNFEQYQVTTEGLSPSSGTTFEYTSTGATYCLSAVSDRAGTTTYHISSTNPSITTGVCPGHIEPTY